MLKGIDVSGYQSATYDVTGLDFVFTKVTEGLSYINPRWAQQRDHAKSKGLVWGAYHYPHMANDPKAEADYFLRQVAWQPGDIVVLDWEGYDSANQGVSKARQLAYRDAWLAYVKAKMPGHRVGMYCNTDYWLNVDKSGNCGDFLWIATGGAAAGQPGIKAPWAFHQYSTAGGIDHDVAAFTDRAALAAWAAGTTPEEDPMAGMTKQDIYDAVWKTDQVAAPADAPDVKTNPTWQPQSYLKDTNTELRALVKKVDALPAVELTDAQIAALAAAVAASPSLAEQIAEQVAAKLAARLAD